MASIATLTIDLIGKSGKLTAELNKANKKTSSWADKTRKMVGSSAKVMAGFGAAGVAAYASIYAKNAEFIDQQAKTADRLGITTQALGGLQHAANLYGASNEELNKSLQTMQKNLGQVGQTGTGEAKYALDGLGLSVQELQGLAPEEQFKVIADKLKGVEDQSQKVYLAQSLMGKSGAKMINVMDAGADGITAMMQEADALGMTFDRIDAAKVEMANDAFDKAQKTTHSFGQTLAIETAPIIGAISDMWTESAKEAGGFGSIAQQVVTKVGSGLGFLSDMGRGLQVTFLLVRQAMAELVNGIVQVGTVASKVGGKLGDALGFDTETLDEINFFADSVSQTTDSLAKELSDLSMAPMPSEKIKIWITDVQTKFEAAAQEQVNNPKKKDLSDLLVNSDPKVADEKAQKLIESARNQYQQIFDAQLAQDGKEVELENRRFERKQQEMEREFQLLRDKNLITAEIEAEYNTAKEQALAQHEQNISLIKQEQLAVREDKEREHQEKLAEGEAQRNQMMQDGYNGLLNVMGGYFGDMEGKNASYAKSAMSIGQTMLDEEKRNSLQSIWTNTYDTAMKAYNALADIPYVGPVLGAAAAGVVIAAGGLYAGKVSGLASFDGGGYTWDGPRTGGLDGKGGQLAMLHPQETVVDHTKGQTLGSNVTVNLFEDASRAGSTTRSSGPSGEEVINIFVTSIRQGGEASMVLENTYGLQRQGF
ncbi:hypothetical protein C7Y70_13255 [Pseudoalteromonas sp. KS88]|uniref:hypothetical protein n=1 Tax=Pseudoalteromonas sp. KS88 TaxID=2109918 RepID=UPI0010818780|nr:hypothetical protein [Pseudoalteromonas sp. KS88]TGE81369.1 hypothetical protein C7Y70_13255 [Pseudoalteromonas sp. KS88]